MSEQTPEERAAAVLQARLSWPSAEACARDLANAGLLTTPERDRRVAAKALWDMADLIDAGPSVRLSPDVYSGLIRERGDDIAGIAP